MHVTHDIVHCQVLRASDQCNLDWGPSIFFIFCHFFLTLREQQRQSTSNKYLAASCTIFTLVRHTNQSRNIYQRNTARLHTD